MPRHSVGAATTATGAAGTGTVTIPPATGSSTTAAGSGGAANARVPATFTLASGGALTPPQISAPAFLAVQVSIVSADGRAHQVVVRTPAAYSLAVPPHGHASVLIPGQRAGRYQVQVDGSPRAVLLIGGEPGP